jgi:hypothetical protein
MKKQTNASMPLGAEMEGTYYGRLFLLERGAKQLLDGFQTHLVDYHSRIQSPSGE